MSLRKVTKVEDAPVCDYCDEEVNYRGSSIGARIDISKENRFRASEKTSIFPKSWVIWKRPKDMIFGEDRYDFHGSCLIEIMDKIEELKRPSDG